MSRYLWPLGAFVLLVAVLAVGLKRAPEKGVIKSPLLGKPAPQFQLPELADPTRTVGSGTLQAGWHLVNVWGTWCGECRAEHPQLLAIQRDGRAPIIGIDWKDDDAQANAWLASLGNPYAQVGADRDGRVSINWGVYGAPETFLVSPQGIVMDKQIGAMTEEKWQQWIHDYVQPPAAGRPLGGGS